MTRQERTSQADWDAYWQTFEAPDSVNHTPEIVDTITRHLTVAGQRVLEIGVGTGGNSSSLAARGAEVVALDFSLPALERALATALDAGVALAPVQANARILPFADASFDLIYHQGFLEHFTDPENFLREHWRVLRPQGHVLIDVPQKYNWYTVYKRRLMAQNRWPYGGWEQEFSAREMATMLTATDFEVVTAYGRGYFPRPWRLLRNLSKVETKLLKRRVLPARLWHFYDQLWRRYERSAVGCNTLQCIGVLARKRSS